MADVNVIPGIEMMLYVWDTTATAAWRPVGCVESNSIDTSLTIEESARISTKCGIVKAKKNVSALTFQFSGNGVAIDSTADAGGVTQASHDFLLQLQRAERTSNKADDWKLASMDTPGIADLFGKGYITDLNKTGDAEGHQTFTFTITGDDDTLADSTTVE